MVVRDAEVGADLQGAELCDLGGAVGADLHQPFGSWQHEGGVIVQLGVEVGDVGGELEVEGLRPTDRVPVPTHQADRLIPVCR